MPRAGGGVGLLHASSRCSGHGGEASGERWWWKLRSFGMLVAVFTVAVMKLLELLAANAQEQWGGPRIQSMRVEKVEDTEEVAAASSTARGSSTRMTMWGGATPRPSSSVADELYDKTTLFAEIEHRIWV